MKSTKPKEPRHIIIAKRQLSRLRVQKRGAMPPDRETWLLQMDEMAEILGIPNIYRTQAEVAREAA